MRTDNEEVRIKKQDQKQGFTHHGDIHGYSYVCEIMLHAGKRPSERGLEQALKRKDKFGFGFGLKVSSAHPKNNRQANP